MNKIILIILLTLAGYTSALSQGSTFLGIEGGINHDQYFIYDPCAVYEEADLLLSGRVGLNVSHTISESFMLESGLIIKFYNEGFQEIIPSFFGNAIISEEAFSAFQIPLRLRYKYNLIKNRFFLATVLGYHLSINLDYKYNSQLYEKDIFSLIEAGIGFEYFINDHTAISLIPSYYGGFKSFYEDEILTNCSTENSIISSNGSYLSLTLGIKYRISN